MAVVPVPRILPRLVRVGDPKRGKETFVFLSEVVRHFVSDLFPGHIEEGRGLSGLPGTAICISTRRRWKTFF